MDEPLAQQVRNWRETLTFFPRATEIRLAGQLGRIFAIGDGKDGYANAPLIYAADEFRRYNTQTGTWVQLDEEEVYRAIHALSHLPAGSTEANAKPYGLTSKKTEGIMRLLKQHLGKRKFFADAPPGACFPNVFIADENKPRLKVLDKPLPEDRVLFEHQLDFPFPNAPVPTPVFDKYIEMLWGHAHDMTERIEFLEEWIGAALVGITTKHKTHLLLVGPSNAGKSRLIELVCTMFPVGARASIPLQKMSTQFGMTGLHGKRINAVNELPKQQMLHTETAKAVMAGDPIELNRKYKDPLMVMIKAGHIIAANCLPPGTDDALRRRLVLLDCPNIVPDDMQDPDLADKLHAERAGIAHRAILGLDRLRKRGAFKRPRSAKLMQSFWRWAADPVAFWASCHLEHDPESWLPASKLHAHFMKWAEANCMPTQSLIPFGRDLSSWGAAPHTMGRSGRGYRVRLIPIAEA